MNILYGVIAALALSIGAFFFGYHQGGLAGKLKDTTAVAKQEAANATRTAVDQSITSQEGKTYAKAIAQAISEPDPAPAVVCVRQYSIQAAALPQPAPTTGSPDAGRGLPAGAGGSVQPITDIGGPVAAIGARAHAKALGLQDYITRVCLTPR